MAFFLFCKRTQHRHAFSDSHEYDRFYGGISNVNTFTHNHVEWNFGHSAKSASLMWYESVVDIRKNVAILIVWCSILMCATLNCLWGRRYSNSKPRIVSHSALTGSNTFQRYALRQHKHWLWFINHFQRRFSSAVLSCLPVPKPNTSTRSHYACNTFRKWNQIVECGAIFQSGEYIGYPFESCIQLYSFFVHTLNGRIWWNRYHVFNTKMKKFNFKWTSHVVPLSRPCIHISNWSEH